MAKRETLLQIADRLEPGVRDAFLASIDRITSDVQIGLLTEAIEARDTARVLRLLQLERGYFTPLDRGLTAAYQEAGDAVMAQWMGQAKAAGVQVRAVFDARNPRAEEWLRSQSSRLITEITDDDIKATQALLARNMEKATAPRTTALDIVGRINRATGRREGGIIGLGSQREKWAARAQKELTLSRDLVDDQVVKLLQRPKWQAADPTDLEREAKRRVMRNYLTRKGRDRRFDRLVMRAIRDEKPIAASDAQKLIGRYRQRLLRQRGEMIARTELLGSTNAAQEEGLEQLVESGKVARENIKAKWDTADDGDQRDSHDAMDGQVRAHGEPFVSGNGYQLLHPGDRSLGAPAEEIINCRCTKRPDVDWIAQAAQEARAA